MKTYAPNGREPTGETMSKERKVIIYGETMREAHRQARGLGLGLSRGRDDVIFLSRDSNHTLALVGVRTDDYEAVGLTREHLSRLRYGF